jgi:hypothetical protein
MAAGYYIFLKEKSFFIFFVSPAFFGLFVGPDAGNRDK